MSVSPGESAKIGKSAKQLHLDRIKQMIGYYEDRFAALCFNAHTPPEDIANLLSAIHGLRLECSVIQDELDV